MKGDSAEIGAELYFGGCSTDVPIGRSGGSSTSSSSSGAGAGSVGGSTTVGTIHTDWPTLDVLCVRYIGRVLARTDGNKTRAAHVLGVNPRTMRRISVTLARGRTPSINTGHNARSAR